MLLKWVWCMLPATLSPPPGNFELKSLDGHWGQFFWGGMRLTKNRAIAKNTKFPHRILLSFGTWSDFRRIGNNSSQTRLRSNRKGKAVCGWNCQNTENRTDFGSSDTKPMWATELYIITGLPLPLPENVPQKFWFDFVLNYFNMYRNPLECLTIFCFKFEHFQSDVKMLEKAFQKPWIFKTFLGGACLSTPPTSRRRLSPLPGDMHWSFKTWRVN